jgi:hypothetical protein
MILRRSLSTRTRNRCTAAGQSQSGHAYKRDRKILELLSAIHPPIAHHIDTYRYLLFHHISTMIDSARPVGVDILDEKPETVRLENPGEDANGLTGTLLKSRLDELSLLRTLWLFRRAVFYTMCVYTGFLCEGFEVSYRI